MRGPSARTLSLFALPLAVFFLGLAGCVDDNVVYQDRPIYTDPPPGAGDFVGYALTNSESPSPSCANCHTGPGARWAETDHANAWATLAGSGNSQEFCKADE